MIKAFIKTTTPRDAVNWRRFTHMAVIERWEDGNKVFAEKHLATSRRAAEVKLDNIFQQYQ